MPKPNRDHWTCKADAADSDVFVRGVDCIANVVTILLVDSVMDKYEHNFYYLLRSRELRLFIYKCAIVYIPWI